MTAPSLTELVCFGDAIPASYFGMNVGYPLELYPDKFTVGFLRLWGQFGVQWAEVETSKGVFDWTTLDAISDLAKRKGVRCVYAFGTTPAWAASAATAPPDDPQDYVDFVSAVATRYPHFHFEIWNEPSTTAHWTGTWAQMVDMARSAYSTIKAISPNAVVLSPSFQGTNGPTKLGEFLKAGGGPYMDKFALHGYWDTNAENIVNYVGQYRSMLASYGITKDIWQTEGCWGRDTGITDMAKRAAFVMKYYLLFAALKIPVCVWYTYLIGIYQNYGTLITADGTALTDAGIAFREVQKWLLGARVGSLKVSGSVYSIGLARDGGYRGLAIWDSAGSTYQPSAEFKRICNSAGDVVALTGDVVLSDIPILLEAR